MPGKILGNAAKIIVSAGAQIDAIVEKLKGSMTQMLEEKAFVVTISDEGSEDRNGWLLTEWMHCFSLKENGRKKNYFGHVNVHFVLHDQQLINVSGWEPTVFVMYAPGKDLFDTDGLKNIVSEDYICQEDQRLWRWGEEQDDVIDSWMFAIPIVSIKNEDDIQNKIVNPVNSLLTHPINTITAFPTNSSFFKFKWEGDTFSMFL
jgi:hypothetical protein